MKYRIRLLNRQLILFLSVIALSGCGGGADSAPQSAGAPAETTAPLSPFKTLTLDASAGGTGALPSDPKNKYTYFDLATGQTVELTDAQAVGSSEWDIAFKRDSIKLNGGISGKKGVSGYSIGNNPEAYEADGKTAKKDWFIDDPGDPKDFFATSDSELPDFTGVTAADIPAETQLKVDQLIPAIKGDGTGNGWWLYNPDTHTASANAAAWWVVRSSEGDSYAKLHVTELVRDSSAAGFRKITLEWAYQGPGEGSFDQDTAGDPQTHLIQIPMAGGAKYLDFDTHAEGEDPAGVPGWDLKVEYDAENRSYRILTHGGVSGAGKGGALALSDPDSVTNGAERSQVAHYFADKTGGIFVDSPWYAYNLTGTDHKLWPNYRVYLVKSGMDVYKLQILAYYHLETRESGWYTFRYEKVSP